LATDFFGFALRWTAGLRETDVEREVIVLEPIVCGFNLNGGGYQDGKA
jgi:hypothetical protein